MCCVIVVARSNFWTQLLIGRALLRVVDGVVDHFTACIAVNDLGMPHAVGFRARKAVPLVRLVRRLPPVERRIAPGLVPRRLLLARMARDRGRQTRGARLPILCSGGWLRCLLLLWLVGVGC